jgi:hypothetical protein
VSRVAAVKSKHEIVDRRYEHARDPLDDAAFAGGVASLEMNYHLELYAHHPVVRRHERALQAKQFVEMPRCGTDDRGAQ